MMLSCDRRRYSSGATLQLGRNTPLIRQSLVNLGIVDPSPGDVSQIPTPDRLAGEPQTIQQCLDRHFVEAPFLVPSALP
jgi:hypothetical protein